MNLIERIGLEKCQAIVDAVPDGGTHFKLSFGLSIFYLLSSGDGADLAGLWIDDGDDSHWGLSSYKNFELFMPENRFISIEDLRTAIADHNQNLSEQRDRFEKAYSLKFPESKVTLLPNGNYSGWIKQKKWKDWQAKQEQLQIELNNCSPKDSSKNSIEDNCTDIRNHISPLTGVIER